MNKALTSLWNTHVNKSPHSISLCIVRLFNYSQSKQIHLSSQHNKFPPTALALTQTAIHSVSFPVQTIVWRQLRSKWDQRILHKIVNKLRGRTKVACDRKVMKLACSSCCSINSISCNLCSTFMFNLFSLPPFRALSTAQLHKMI